MEPSTSGQVQVVENSGVLGVNQVAPAVSAKLVPRERAAIRTKELRLFYGEALALQDITMNIAQKAVTAFIGPSGCGKSTLLRCFNRMNDLIDDVKVSGSVSLADQEIFSEEADVSEIRRKVGMVFQKSNPFPKSIYDNVAYGLRIHGIRDRSFIDHVVEESLRSVALWKEVSHRLKDSALGLSGGQQQRLCIARAIAIEPEVLLMDEPCSSLDPIATEKVEELILDLKRRFTIVIVTHNMQQAVRVSDYTAFIFHGELVEFGKTKQVFNNPLEESTKDYVAGRFG